MEKEKLFLDFDGTIADSITAFCRLYSYLYADKIGFVLPETSKVNRWNFSDQCKLLKDSDVEKLFSNELFFNFLEFMPNAKETILKLAEKYDIYIVSIGTMQNIRWKANWLDINLPEVKNVILISNNNCEMNKSIVNMSSGILLDDNYDNLKTCNAIKRYTFGIIKSWNIWSPYKRLFNWECVGKELL